MKPNEARELLVKALRSGEYNQATDQLKKIDERGEESFCCLGVACDLYMKHNYGCWDGTNFFDGQKLEWTRLTTLVRNWFGFKNTNCTLREEFRYDFYGNLSEDGEIDSLAGLNDSGASFNQIANVIERGEVRTVDA